MVKKRENVISWDEYFMGVALLSSNRSKDPNTQVGACIVNDQKRIIGIGYNGFPSGVSDDVLPWDRKADNVYDTKYPYVIHAEANALLNSMTSIKGCSIYVTLFPCPDCMKLLCQSNIKKIIYKDNLYEGTPEQIASKKLADVVGVELIQYKDLVK